MEEYIEIACIKDENTVIGFFLINRDFIYPITPASDCEILSYGGNVDYVSLEEMKNIIKDNLVEGSVSGKFIYNDGLDRIEYIKIKGETLTKLTLMQYLSYDIIIHKKYFDFMKNNNKLCGFLDGVGYTEKFLLDERCHRTEICAIRLFGNMNYLRQQISNLSDAYPTFQKFYNSSVIGDNMATLFLPVSQYLKATRGIDMLVNVPKVYNSEKYKSICQEIKLKNSSILKWRDER